MKRSGLKWWWIVAVGALALGVGVVSSSLVGEPQGSAEREGGLVFFSDDEE